MTTPGPARTNRPHAATTPAMIGSCAVLTVSLLGSLGGCKSDGLEPVGAGPSTTSGTFYQSPTMGTPMPTSSAPGVRSQSGGRGQR